jgi:ribonucleoside-triphosphate reductase
LEAQDELQVLYTSGTVFHAYLGEKLPDWKAAAALVRKIAENYRLPYYTISPTYSVCRTHGYISGEHYMCPECGEEAEVYSRITGYYRPVKNWNEGKAQEFKDRRVYNAGKSNRKSDAGSPMQNKELLLFTTPTCANCSMAKKALAEAGIAYRMVDAAKHQELVEKYDVRQAPTLVDVTDSGTEKFSGLVSVQEYISNHLSEACVF